MIVFITKDQFYFNPSIPLSSCCRCMV